MRIGASIAAGMVVALAAGLHADQAGARPISERDDFLIGSGPNSCVAQLEPHAERGSVTFDRTYSLLCRDASDAIGRLHAIRAPEKPGASPSDRMLAIDCGPPRALTNSGLEGARVAECKSAGGGAPYLRYSLNSDRSLYVAEGLAGFDSALLSGLRSLVRDRELQEQLTIPAVTDSETVDLARARADRSDPLTAFTEGYDLNNDGRYAEAAEYFSVLLRDESSRQGLERELLAAFALQQSNLGAFQEADASFARLQDAPRSTGATEQFVRNAHATHLLNSKRFDEALLLLRGSDDGARPAPAASQIDAVMADQLNSQSIFLKLATDRATPLAQPHRDIILTAQRHLIEASILRLQQHAHAGSQLARAKAILAELGPEQQPAAARLHSQILTEEAVQAAARGASTLAEQQYRQAVAVLTAAKPDTPAHLMAKARLAGHLATSGQAEAALSAFAEIVRSPALQQAAVPGLKEALRPYFRLLLAKGPNAGAPKALFFASQLALAPGVAHTQAVLARELSAGGTDATQLFRRSVTAGRVVEQLTAEYGRAEQETGPDARDKLAALGAKLRAAKEEQVAALSALSGFSQFRAITSQAVELGDLQAVLRDGETYWKLSAVGQDVYALVVTKDNALAYLLPVPLDRLNKDLLDLRDSISVVEDGETVMYPFDVELAHHLYKTLAGPAAALINNSAHLIFEADGEMSRLPVGVLVTDGPSRSADPYDFTGVAWLGRQVATTTSVSARGFRDIRAAPPSRAAHEYIGFGENTPLGTGAEGGGQVTRTASRCAWPAAAWNRPISSSELKVAQSVIGDSGARILTRDDFTDTRIKQLDDLDQYRIVHFATHGLTDAPHRGCSAEPALLTSVAPDPQSDGLLTFREIFDLRLDADLVILSACSTASGASKRATADAGLRGSGEFPLDGLVRAFVGAGSRSVIATHWPVPDDYEATERLLGGLFRQPRGTTTADAIRLSQAALMNDKVTSHPFYWAAFVVIGDGGRPLLPRAR